MVTAPVTVQASLGLGVPAPGRGVLVPVGPGVDSDCPAGVDSDCPAGPTRDSESR